MFNWSGNKASFAGDIPFYGKTGLDFYTQRKVSYDLFRITEADHRLRPRCGLLKMPWGIKWVQQSRETESADV